MRTAWNKGLVKNTTLKDFLSGVGNTQCWMWKRGKASAGYGEIWWKGKGTTAHRVSYELFIGKIPKKKQIDHLCRNRSCVNPTHLEVVSARENVLRGVGITAQNAKKTHCLNGHLFGKSNTYRYKYPKRPNVRVCKVCVIDRTRERRLKNNLVQNG